MKHLIAAQLLLASGVLAHSLPEISVHKRDKHTHGRTNDVARGMVRRAGTLETTVFSGVGFVSGGAYYANSRSSDRHSWATKAVLTSLP